MWFRVSRVRVPLPTPDLEREPEQRFRLFFINTLIMGCRQVVRHGTLTPAFAGSSPATPARLFIQFEYRDDPVAQSAEHLPFKQGVRGSNPRWVTKNQPPNPCPELGGWFLHERLDSNSTTARRPAKTVRGTVFECAGRIPAGSPSSENPQTLDT